jgi:hypothetical protein
MLAAMMPSPMQGLYTGMSVPPVPPAQSPHATLLSSAPPRDFYCWLHGWNNTRHGGTCNIMGTNQAYTPTMRSARGRALMALVEIPKLGYRYTTLVFPIVFLLLPLVVLVALSLHLLIFLHAASTRGACPAVASRARCPLNVTVCAGRSARAESFFFRGKRK